MSWGITIHPTIFYSHKSYNDVQEVQRDIDELNINIEQNKRIVFMYASTNNLDMSIQDLECELTKLFDTLEEDIEERNRLIMLKDEFDYREDESIDYYNIQSYVPFWKSGLERKDAKGKYWIAVYNPDEHNKGNKYNKERFKELTLKSEEGTLSAKKILKDNEEKLNEYFTKKELSTITKHLKHED